MDVGRYPILYVDDERQNLVAVSYLLEGEFDLVVAQRPEDAIEILTKQDIAVLLTDQRMPGMTGVELCVKARELRPDTVRIIITAHADMHDAIAAINRGQVAKFVTKPFRNEELIETLRMAIDLVHVQRAVKDMQSRLLRTGPQATALAIGKALARELQRPHAALRAALPRARDLTRAAGRERADADRVGALLDETGTAQDQAMVATTELGEIVDRLTVGEVLPISDLAATDVARVVDATVRILRSDLERTARVEFIAESTPWVRMRSADLGQVMTNLLMAAVSFFAPDGDAPRTLTVRVGGTGAEVLITVTAAGVDMQRVPELTGEDPEVFFDPKLDPERIQPSFALAVARSMIGSAKGTVGARSTSGGAVVLSLELPAARRISSLDAGDIPPPGDR